MGLSFDSRLFPGSGPLLSRVSGGGSVDRYGKERVVLLEIVVSRGLIVLFEKRVSATETLRVIGSLPGSGHVPIEESELVTERMLNRRDDA